MSGLEVISPGVLRPPRIETVPPTTAIAPIDFYHNKETGLSKVRILDVALDVFPMPTDENGNIDSIAARFIPSWEKFKDSTVWDMPTLLLLRDMAIKLNGGVASRITGPTGVSKSFCAEVLCALTNRSYYRHNFSRDSDVGDIIGRFVPKEEKLQIRFDELLQIPDLKDESIKIIEKARAQTRSLTILEQKLIARYEGFNDLANVNDSEWTWKNGPLTGAMMYSEGVVFNPDEMNLAPPNVRERQNSIQERHPTLRMVEHEGEIIRELTKEEQDIIDHGGIIPGVTGLGRRFWYVVTENPWGIGGGRTEPSEAELNRLQNRVVPAIGQEEYYQFLNYNIAGDQPDIKYLDRVWKGAKDLNTEFRKSKRRKPAENKPQDLQAVLTRIETKLGEPAVQDFEDIPNLEIVNKWLSKFQNDLANLVAKGKIGSEKDLKGGSYIYTRRNLVRFLDTMRSAHETLIDVNHLFKTGELRYNESWRDIFWEGLNQEYLSDMYQADRDAVMKVVEASGILDYLGPSQNIHQLPNWAKRAQNQGLNVEEGNGKWKISKIDLTNFQIDLSALQADVLAGDYTVEDSGDVITITRKLKGILELWGQENRLAAQRVKHKRSGKDS